MKAILKAMPNLHKGVIFTTGATRDSTNVKQIINCTSAKFNVTTLHLPRIIHCSDQHQLDLISYIDKLKLFLRQLQPPAVRSHQRSSSYVSSATDSCTHVSIQHDIVKTSLQHSPFKLIKCTNKPLH